MGKSNLSCNVTRHAGATTRGGGAPRCITCGLVIFYGDRCPACERELRQRKRRKRR